MASTPASRVIAVTAPESVPSVETIITTSPFCRSASELFGNRLSRRCKSSGPFPPGTLAACASADFDVRALPAPARRAFQSHRDALRHLRRQLLHLRVG